MKNKKRKWVKRDSVKRKRKGAYLHTVQPTTLNNFYSQLGPYRFIF